MFINNTLLDKYDLLAIIYSNSPQTDQTIHIIDMLDRCKEKTSCHIYPMDNAHGVVWIISKKHLTNQILLDIIAQEWVDQAQVTYSTVDFSLFRKPGYAAGVAADLTKYLGHRHVVLNNMMNALCRDLKWPAMTWNEEKFAEGVSSLGDEAPNFLNCVYKISEDYRKVVITALSIGSVSGQLPQSLDSSQ